VCVGWVDWGRRELICTGIQFIEPNASTIWSTEGPNTVLWSYNAYSPPSLGRVLLWVVPIQTRCRYSFNQIPNKLKALYRAVLLHSDPISNLSPHWGRGIHRESNIHLGQICRRYIPNWGELSLQQSLHYCRPLLHDPKSWGHHSGWIHGIGCGQSDSLRHCAYGAPIRGIVTYSFCWRYSECHVKRSN